MDYAITIEGVMGRSTPEACKELGITRPTMAMWILEGKIKPKIHRIGKKRYYDFPDQEIDRVKKLINKKWEPGYSKLEGGRDI